MKLCGSCKHWQMESSKDDEPAKKMCEALSYQSAWENGHKPDEDYDPAEDRTPFFEIMNSGSSPGPSQIWTRVSFQCAFWTPK